MTLEEATGCQVSLQSLLHHLSCSFRAVCRKTTPRVLAKAKQFMNQSQDPVTRLRSRQVDAHGRMLGISRVYPYRGA